MSNLVFGFHGYGRTLIINGTIDEIKAKVDGGEGIALKVSEFEKGKYRADIETVYLQQAGP